MSDDMLREYDVSHAVGMSSYISNFPHFPGFRRFLRFAHRPGTIISVPPGRRIACPATSWSLTGRPARPAIRPARPAIRPARHPPSGELTQPFGCYRVATDRLLYTEDHMPFPDRIERTVELA